MFHAYSEKPPVRQCAERGSKRKRHGEEYEEVDQNLEYGIDTHHERGMSESFAVARTCGSPVFYASPVLGGMVCDDLPVSPRVLPASILEEAIECSILERGFKSLSVVESSENTPPRSRAAAFVCRPIAVRSMLAEIPLAEALPSHAADAVVGSLSSPRQSRFNK